MLSEISTAQLEEWMEFSKLEPFGFGIENLLHGSLCATVASTVPTRTRKRLKPSDFMLQTKKKLQTPEEMLAIFKRFAAKGA